MSQKLAVYFWPSRTDPHRRPALIRRTAVRRTAVRRTAVRCTAVRCTAVRRPPYRRTILVQVVLRQKSRPKVETILFLSGEASYRHKKSILRNEFVRRIFLSMVLLF